MRVRKECVWPHFRLIEIDELTVLVCVHLSATKRHFPPQTGKTVVRQVQLSLRLMICTPAPIFTTPIILSSNGADLQHTGSSSSSSHLGKFSSSWKVWNASPLLENGPNLNSRLFEWRLARGASDAFLFIAQEGFSFSHSTVQGRGTETAWRATKLCKSGKHWHRSGGVWETTQGSFLSLKDLCSHFPDRHAQRLF